MRTPIHNCRSQKATSSASDRLAGHDGDPDQTPGQSRYAPQCQRGGEEAEHHAL